MWYCIATIRQQLGHSPSLQGMGVFMSPQSGGGCVHIPSPRGGGSSAHVSHSLYRGRGCGHPPSLQGAGVVMFPHPGDGGVVTHPPCRVPASSCPLTQGRGGAGGVVTHPPCRVPASSCSSRDTSGRRDTSCRRPAPTGRCTSRSGTRGAPSPPRGSRTLSGRGSPAGSRRARAWHCLRCTRSCNDRRAVQGRDSRNKI